MNRLRIWLAGGTAAMAVLAAVPPAAAQEDPAGIAEPGSAAPAVLPGHVRPMWHIASQPAGVTPDTIGEPGGYDPYELRSYLDLTGTGKGQTVAIVEAWNVESAVTTAVGDYTSWFGVKPPCSDAVTSGCFNLTFQAPDGFEPVDTIQEIQSTVSFQLETALDVEMVHAIAPDAAITVVQAHDNSDDAVMSALDHAVALKPAVVSNSYGESEFDGEQALDQHCQEADVPCVFSSGDAGNPGGYPAANPNVLAVGGTTLDVGPTGKVRSEIAWEGSGGGISQYEPRPGYQQAADPYDTGRGLPDVSFDADPQSGVAVYVVQEIPNLGLRTERWVEVGGTSAGAPAWAAILAVADQLRAASGKPALTTADVHAAVYDRHGQHDRAIADITQGANGICGAICTAGPGYDLVTGEGSPRPGIDTYLAKH